MSADEKIFKDVLIEAMFDNRKYTIAIKESGVFLTVDHAEDKDALPETVIYDELEKNDIKQYDREVILRAIQEASKEFKIADLPEVGVEVIISRDRMEATLNVTRPTYSMPVTLEDLIEKIKQAGVVFGFDQEKIQMAYEHPGTEVVCATGQSPINGENSYIKYFINTENKCQPAELEDGRVDFKNLNLFTVVKQGDILAEKIAATPGIPGIDVLGLQLVAKPGKDIPMPIGKNVNIVDNNTIAATISGQILIANKKISVMPVIEIKSDVDLSTGNIEFVGNVIVHGSVQPGFSIKAEGNVEIYGSISGATIEGKNVIVKMGIQGMHRGYIKAVENVVAKFIENASVYAGQDVIVSDVILHSRVNAGKKVVVEGRRGLITGGMVMAGEEIRAKVVGTEMASSTELEVGVNPLLREEYQNIRRDMKKLEINLEQTQKALNILKSMNQNTMPQDKRELLLKLTKAQFQLVGQVENMRNRISEIEVIFEEMRMGCIRVSDCVYPGVKIVVGTIVKPIREILKFVSFSAEDGEIKLGTYK